MCSSVPLKPSRPELHPVLSPARSQTTGVRGCCPQKPVKPIQYAVSTARTIKPDSLKSQSRMNRQTGEMSGLAGQRAAIVMSLVQSAKLNGHDPWAYLRDVLEL